MPTVCFVTLSRSDYASTRPVIRAAQADERITPLVVAGGSHLLTRYGRTIDDLARDGITVDHQLDFLHEEDDSDSDLAAAYARCVEQSVALLQEARPDKLFLLGDRWEMMAVASAASMLRIPIIHHSGGDITQGSADNQTRYVLSTLAHLHLVALEDHGTRLTRMGEEPWRVSVVGEPALCEIQHAKRPDIRAHVGLKAETDFVLATFHPTSYDALPMDDQLAFYLDVLRELRGDVILTAPNPDAYSGAFYKGMKAYADANTNIHWIESLGAGYYYAAMEAARFMVGNSSSGLWEAPSFALPVVNIGNRQQGRVHGANVINVPLEMEALRQALTQAASDDFRAGLSVQDNPYVRSDTLARIMDACKSTHSRETLLAKQLIDPLEQQA